MEEELGRKLRQLQRRRDYLITEYKKRMGNIEQLEQEVCEMGARR